MAAPSVRLLVAVLAPSSWPGPPTRIVPQLGRTGWTPHSPRRSCRQSAEDGYPAAEAMQLEGTKHSAELLQKLAESADLEAQFASISNAQSRAAAMSKPHGRLCRSCWPRLAPPQPWRRSGQWPYFSVRPTSHLGYFRLAAIEDVGDQPADDGASDSGAKPFDGSKAQYEATAVAFSHGKPPEGVWCCPGAGAQPDHLPAPQRPERVGCCWADNIGLSRRNR